MPKFDFSKQSTLDSLYTRNARYWQSVGVGRSLGIYVSPQGLQLWKARYRSTSGLYKETTLGFAWASTAPSPSARPQLPQKHGSAAIRSGRMLLAGTRSDTTEK